MVGSVVSVDLPGAESAYPAVSPSVPVVASPVARIRADSAGCFDLRLLCGAGGGGTGGAGGTPSVRLTAGPSIRGPWSSGSCSTGRRECGVLRSVVVIVVPLLVVFVVVDFVLMVFALVVTAFVVVIGSRRPRGCCGEIGRAHV